jgi:hypothetical protein
MNYRLLFLSFMLLAALSTMAEPVDASKEHHRKGRLLRLYSYGLPAYSFTDSCELMASKKSGFKVIVKAGCVIRGGQICRWDLHNKRVERKLDKRNGPDWWDKYILEASNCSRNKN